MLNVNRFTRKLFPLYHHITPNTAGFREGVRLTLFYSPVAHKQPAESTTTERGMLFALRSGTVNH